MSRVSLRLDGITDETRALARSTRAYLLMVNQAVDDFDVHRFQNPLNLDTHITLRRSITGLMEALGSVPDSLPSHKFTHIFWVTLPPRYRQLDVESAAFQRFYTRLREITAYAFSSYGDDLLKLLREGLIEDTEARPGDLYYPERRSNCPVFDEALGIQSTDGKAVFTNLQNGPGTPSSLALALEYALYAREKLSQTRINWKLRRSQLPDIPACAVYEVQSTLDWIKRTHAALGFDPAASTFAFIPFISLSEFLAYRAFSNGWQEDQEALTQAGWAVDSWKDRPEKRELFELMYEFISYLLRSDVKGRKLVARGHNPADVLQGLSGNITSIARSLRVVLDVGLDGESHIAVRNLMRRAIDQYYARKGVHLPEQLARVEDLTRRLTDIDPQTEALSFAIRRLQTEMEGARQLQSTIDQHKQRATIKELLLINPGTALAGVPHRPHPRALMLGNPYQIISTGLLARRSIKSQTVLAAMWATLVEPNTLIFIPQTADGRGIPDTARYAKLSGRGRRGALQSMLLRDDAVQTFLVSLSLDCIHPDEKLELVRLFIELFR